MCVVSVLCLLCGVVPFVALVFCFILIFPGYDVWLLCVVLCLCVSASIDPKE